jgi:mediator of RNA polymerase II transcription subunit 5
MTTARAKWTDFFTRSLAARLSFRDFKAYTTLLAATHPLPPADLADIFLSPTPTNDFCLDMRVPRYLLLLLDLDLVSASAILGALRRHSTFRTHAEQTARHGRSAPDAEPEPDPPPAPKRWAMSFASDETLFYRLAKHLTAPPPRPAAPSEPTALLREVLAWLAVATAARSPDVLELGPALAAAMAMATAALATLLLAVVEDARVQRVLARERAVCKRVAGAVGAFVPLVAQGSPQSAARLEMFCAQTLGGLGVGGEGEEKGVKGDERGEGDGGGGGNEASKEIDRILDGVGGHAELELEVQGMAVVDLPVMNSRAGLYVYLNALVSSCSCLRGCADCCSWWEDHLLMIRLFLDIYTIDIK